MKDEILFLKKDIESKNKKIISLKDVCDEKIEMLSFINEDIKTKDKLLKKQKKEISNLKKVNKKLKKQNKEILSSSSWKVTSPIRKSKYYFKKIFKPIFKKNKNIAPQLGSFHKFNESSEGKCNFYLVKNSFAPINYFDNYKIHLINKNNRRVNLFLDDVSDSIFVFNNLFSFLIEYCKEFNYSLRIVYNNIDFDLFKDFFKKNNLNLRNLSFLNLKKENFLEVAFNEKFVCTSLRTIKSLLNNSFIKDNIYFYIGDLNEYSQKEIFQISNLIYKNNIVILNEYFYQQKDLKKFNYNYNLYFDKNFNFNEKTICCDFGDLILEGMDLLNYIFLNNLIDKDWKIFIKTDYNLSKLYVYSNEVIDKLSVDVNNFSWYLNLSLEKMEYASKNNIINIFIDEEINNEYPCLNILDRAEIYNFDYSNSSSKYESFNKIDELFIKINEVK